MTRKSIIFKAQDVRAILSGRKTQFREPIKFINDGLQKYDIAIQLRDGSWSFWYPGTHKAELEEFVTTKAYPNGGGFVCPYGKVGDSIWVRETWSRIVSADGSDCIAYKADGAGITVDKLLYAGWGARMTVWKSSATMPSWASRITLEITNIRVERVQDISEDDAMLEGVGSIEDKRANPDSEVYRNAFRDAWYARYLDSDRGWEANPWVWVVEFKRIKP